MRDCPFPGLLPFREKDAPFFFGRDQEIGELLARLQRQRFVGVLGVSGSGKSSLVHAGIKPELRGQGWRIVEMRPGNAPAAHLAAELSKELPGQDWANLLGGSSYGLSDGIGKALRGADVRLLIVVDQFEEIFEYWDKDPGKADLFVQQILRAASLPGLAAYVVITMRTDFLGRCSLFRNLPEALNEASYLVPRLTRKEQEEAIRLPLAVVGVEIEPSVVDDLLNASEKYRDELPVLQHLLKRLWEECGGTGTIGAAHLARAGGWEEAISRDAESVFDPLSAGEQDAVRLLFQRITKKGTGERPVRTPCGFGELAAICSSLVSQQRLLEVMGGFRKRDLLVWETEKRIDIPHECLAWRWKTLADWIEAEDRDRHLLDFIATSRQGNSPLDGFKLDEARKVQPRLKRAEWAARYGYDAAELRAWIDLSTNRQSQAARNRWMIIGSVAACLLFAAWLWLDRELSAQNRTRVAYLQTQALNAKLEDANHQREMANRSLERANQEVGKALGAEKQARAEAALQRMKGVWQAAARQAARDAEGHVDDDRSALLARQAFLFHRLTPNEPRYLVEEALQASIDDTVFSHVLAGHHGYVYSVVFSPDGARVATTGYDKSVRLWNLSRPALSPDVLAGHKSYVFSAAFSFDGALLASASDDGTVRIWDLASNREKHVLSGHGSNVHWVSFLPNGTQLASLSPDSGVLIWDLRQSPPTSKLLPGLVGRALRATFSPSGKQFAVGTVEGSVSVWDPNAMDSRPQLIPGCQGFADSLAISPDGTSIACGGQNGVRLVNLQSPDVPPKVIAEGRSVILSVAFSPDGTHLAAAGKQLRVWDLTAKQVAPCVLVGHEDIVVSVAFSPDGRRLASSGKDGMVRIWDLTPTAMGRVVFNGDEGYVESVAFSRDGGRVAAASTKGMARLWDVNQPGAPPQFLSSQGDVLTSLAFSPDGALIATAGSDKTVRLWKVDGPSLPVRTLSGHRSQIQSVSFSPDSTRLVSGSLDSTVRVWNLLDPLAPPQILIGHEGAVNSVAFSPDGLSVASSGNDRTIRLWSLARSKPAPQVLSAHDLRVQSVSFSPNGKQLASASWDQTIRLWNLSNLGALPQVLSTPSDRLAGISSVAFSPDGTRLASGTWDQEVQIWDLLQPKAKPIVLMGHHGYVHSVAFSPDGGLLASGSEDESVRLWPIWQRAAETVCMRVWRNLSMEEWKFYIGEGIPYERTCPNLPPGAGAPQ